jgi:pimeloyl-ACP methyl ester carboxylesterase
MLNQLRSLNYAMPILTGFFWGSVAFAMSPLNLPLGLFLGTMAAFLTYLELVTQWSFRAPSKRKEPIHDEEWEKEMVGVDAGVISTYHRAGIAGEPTLVLIHGWTSGSIRMTSRAQQFIDRDWSVVLIDLPSHGASSPLKKWSAEQSSTLVINALNTLHKRHRAMFDGDVYFYGHSIGGFHCLRFSKRRSELQFGDQLSGWILESPMTGYSEIFDETCNILRIPHILRPIVLRKTIRHFNAINGPERMITELTDADTPQWGIPQEPTLLVQAYPDDRLGSTHHERLVRVMKESNLSNMLTEEYLTDLQHSGSAICLSRDQAISRWIEKAQNHSSSD